MKPGEVNRFYIGLRGLVFDPGRKVLIHDGRIDIRGHIRKEYPYILEIWSDEGKTIYVSKQLLVNHEVELLN